MTDTLKFLDYDERPAFPPRATAYHECAITLGASAKGVKHAYGQHRLHRLLVHSAAEPTGEILLALHGGRWSHGYKEHMSLMAPPLNRRGITLVSASYRLLPADPYPSGLEDCAAALRWIEDHLDLFGGKADALFIGGHSAGGHYAALVAVAPERAGGSVPRVAGCLPISGIFKINADEIPGQTIFPGGASDAAYAAASPVSADLSKSPPFLISWGSDDTPPVPAQSVMMAQALRDAGAEVETLILENADHFDAGCRAAEMNGPWIKAAENFMRRHRS